MHLHSSKNIIVRAHFSCKIASRRERHHRECSPRHRGLLENFLPISVTNANPYQIADTRQALEDSGLNMPLVLLTDGYTEQSNQQIAEIVNFVRRSERVEVSSPRQRGFGRGCSRGGTHHLSKTGQELASAFTYGGGADGLIGLLSASISTNCFVFCYGKGKSIEHVASFEQRTSRIGFARYIDKHCTSSLSGPYITFAMVVSTVTGRRSFTAYIARAQRTLGGTCGPRNTASSAKAGGEGARDLVMVSHSVDGGTGEQRSLVYR